MKKILTILVLLSLLVLSGCGEDIECDLDIYVRTNDGTEFIYEDTCGYYTINPIDEPLKYKIMLDVYGKNKGIEIGYYVDDVEVIGVYNALLEEETE